MILFSSHFIHSSHCSFIFSPCIEFRNRRRRNTWRLTGHRLCEVASIDLSHCAAIFDIEQFIWAEFSNRLHGSFLNHSLHISAGVPFSDAKNFFHAFLINVMIYPGYLMADDGFPCRRIWKRNINSSSQTSESSFIKITRSIGSSQNEQILSFLLLSSIHAIELHQEFSFESSARFVFIASSGSHYGINFIEEDNTWCLF